MLDESQTSRQTAARSTLGDLCDVLEENGNDWQRVRPRKIPAEQQARLEGHAREIFETLGMDLSSPATVHTPRRFIKGADVLGRPGAEARLLSVRMHRSYLFLRYRLGEVNDNE